ncbi:FKBP-type peptidyl-prolyl cis-trans isomerase [Marseilla massiliensis]|uniref:FKBP-type peptidyl-prolyl cis-trans isomerase n=1 Tax=Marseilla massiliensis TaxID=1841864 RepID=UPI00201185F9|nr:FKBP-type peptidyl-prolyl cis-trans isomerase [Marseilla massiliensis]MCL1610708.1 FKBP-type peptidyl-prolyl cis-trans isomerase [Marseilla massiliensis]
MKKTLMLVLVVLASASFNVAYAAKKKKKKAEETVQPVQLASPSDSLSYVVGMVMTNGLIPYLQQAEGVDTAYMADFIRGFNEMIKSGDDPKVKAYSAGMGIAARLKGQMLEGMKKEFTDTPDTIVAPLVYRGFTDALQGDTTVMKADEAEAAFKAKREYNKAAKDEKLYGPNREAGKQFLAENAKKDSVVTLPSGLQYKVLVKGTGEIPAKSDRVQVNYEGRLIDGTVFDSSSKHGSKPATFRADQVIKGWTEALTMMPVGSKWQLFIPQELAYGERQAGQIKPYSALIFTVELVGIDKPEAKSGAKAGVDEGAKVKKVAPKARK